MLLEYAAAAKKKLQVFLWLYRNSLLYVYRGCKAVITFLLSPTNQLTSPASSLQQLRNNVVGDWRLLLSLNFMSLIVGRSNWMHECDCSQSLKLTFNRITFVLVYHLFKKLIHD